MEILRFAEDNKGETLEERTNRESAAMQNISDVLNQDFTLTEQIMILETLKLRISNAAFRAIDKLQN